ncbi:ubiquinol-cytochrome c reductase iron-sulfur subunit [Allocatelliglobosispora scoriae]|uniref:Cytochrome bc1 complex Rieske iron-sulfur subunit n=1 Tax=Allocatelliglobosispora scoriae TaxID=643052 RepID=A0A841BK42_9ACTN|nr:Rieske 2Fe-2S domain-containing protein [Allocatelliglobosispora scoriae]MBB5869467.1 ubiquinol-cytochrome c reductase iron-sulfur subunit [Allocatelliglobosispora scoriae]
MSAEETTPSGVDLSDPKLTNEQILTEGLRRDDIEIVHYEPQFPVPGTKAERRLERVVAFLFLLAGLAALGFVAVYIWGPWNPDEYPLGASDYNYYTPALGALLGLALTGVGLGVLTYGKKLLPHEIAIQQRHDGPSSDEDRTIAVGTLGFIGNELGIQRRPLIKGALAVTGAGLGAAALAVPLGMLIKDPHKKNEHGLDPYTSTGFNPKYNDGNLVRLVREDYTPIRPEDVSIGGQITAFPGIPHGTSNQFADSPVLVIHLREDDAAELRGHLADYSANALASADDPNSGGMWENIVVYSKICTHAGCPASLYEQQTNKLLCPCHQSQFLITENARPVFGPATRRLPMLPVTVDEEGFLVAKRDFAVSVGPGYWERPNQ